MSLYLRFSAAHGCQDGKGNKLKRFNIQAVARVVVAETVGR
jgi:hypothetical protein